MSATKQVAKYAVSAIVMIQVRRLLKAWRKK